MKQLLTLCLISIGVSVQAQYLEEQNGYLIVNGVEYSGLIALNLNNNSVMMDQDTINRMFHQGIERVVLGEASQNTYVTKTFEGEKALFRVVVDGPIPLLERLGFYFSNDEGDLIMLTEDEKAFFSLFGREKKQMKEYAFLRNISIEDEQGIISLFTYYNSNYSQ